MRYVRCILAASMLAGCDTYRLAVPRSDAPVPAAGPNAWVAILVVGAGGLCIPGASVRVVSGQLLGETRLQEPWCDAWSDGGITFSKLTHGVEMTITASAPGYADLSKTLVPDPFSKQATLFVLSPQ